MTSFNIDLNKNQNTSLISNHVSEVKLSLRKTGIKNAIKNIKNKTSDFNDLYSLKSKFKTKLEEITQVIMFQNSLSTSEIKITSAENLLKLQQEKNLNGVLEMIDFILKNKYTQLQENLKNNNKSTVYNSEKEILYLLVLLSDICINNLDPSSFKLKTDNDENNLQILFRLIETLICVFNDLITYNEDQIKNINDFSANQSNENNYLVNILGNGQIEIYLENLLTKTNINFKIFFELIYSLNIVIGLILKENNENLMNMDILFKEGNFEELLIKFKKLFLFYKKVQNYFTQSNLKNLSLNTQTNNLIYEYHMNSEKTKMLRNVISSNIPNFSQNIEFYLMKFNFVADFIGIFENIPLYEIKYEMFKLLTHLISFEQQINNCKVFCIRTLQFYSDKKGNENCSNILKTGEESLLLIEKIKNDKELKLKIFNFDSYLDIFDLNGFLINKNHDQINSLHFFNFLFKELKNKDYTEDYYAKILKMLNKSLDCCYDYNMIWKVVSFFILLFYFYFFSLSF